MRSLSVQVHPNRTSDVDMSELSQLFGKLAERIDLVSHHAFDYGDDNGPYYNFTFGTAHPAALWQEMQRLVYQSPKFQRVMANASMAMCSSEAGWDDYAQLFHWDPAVPLVPVTAL